MKKGKCFCCIDSPFGRDCVAVDTRVQNGEDQVYSSAFTRAIRTEFLEDFALVIAELVIAMPRKEIYVTGICITEVE